MTKTAYDLKVIALKEQLDACLKLIGELKTYNTKQEKYERVASYRNIEKTLLEKRNQLIKSEQQH